MLLAQKISPGFMDAIFAAIGFKMQKTNSPKQEDAPDNLYEPISGYNQVEGDFSNKTQPSLTTWLNTDQTL